MPILRARGASSLVVLLLLGFAGSGCIRTDFVQSSPSFVVHAAAQRPVVYFDHLPEQPYTSVGVIDVIAPTSSRLEDVFAAAADKGKEIGCDLVVDRSIYRVADAALPRWHVTALDVLDSPPPRASREDARDLGYAPGPTPVVVVPAQPAPATTYTPVYTPPPDRREFICGVWTQAQPPAAPAPPAPPAP